MISLARLSSAQLVVAVAALSMAACDDSPTGSNVSGLSFSVAVVADAWPDSTVRPESITVTTTVRNEGADRVELSGLPDFASTVQIIRSAGTGDTVWVSPTPPLLLPGPTSIAPREEFRMIRRWDLRNAWTRQPVPAGDYLVSAEYLVVSPNGERVKFEARPITIRVR